MGRADPRPHGLRAPRIELPEQCTAAPQVRPLDHPLGTRVVGQGVRPGAGPAWSDYTDQRGSLFRSRSDIEDALDFIGWYNHGTARELEIAKTDARNLYLAYHEGRGGYRKGSWKGKPKLQRIAERVAETTRRYEGQLKRCESEFRCGSWWQVWPFCS